MDKVVEQMRRGGARIIHNCSFPSAQYAFKEVADLMLTIISKSSPDNELNSLMNSRTRNDPCVGECFLSDERHYGE